MIKKKIFLSSLLAVCILLSIYALFIEPQRVKTSHLYINDTELSLILKNKKAVHISDLHINKIGFREKTALKIIEGIKPDLIFLTGDYVDWNGDYSPALMFLSKLEAPLGVWAVMGDYDYSFSTP